VRPQRGLQRAPQHRAHRRPEENRSAHHPQPRLQDQMTAHAQLQAIIEGAWENRASLSPKSTPAEIRAAVEQCIGLLDSGAARVAEKSGGHWVVNEWLKKAVLLYFRANDNQVMDGGFTRFFDKVPLKYAQHDDAAFRAGGARVVPHAVVRKGSYVAADAVL